MKKLSKITESIWSDMQDRSSGETIRKEDKFNPDYVDFGDDTTVYWAIDNLEIDGEGKFYFDNIKDYNNNGWRLPTVDEVNQLKWNIWIAWYKGCNHLKFDDGNELKLKTNNNDGFHMWTKDNTKFPIIAYAYGFDNSDDFDITSFNKSINRLFVFLVKDKKITESIWSDIQDRSVGNVRKEDGRIIGQLKNGTKLIMPNEAWTDDGELVEFDGSNIYTFNESGEEAYIAVINEGDTDVYYRYDEDSEDVTNMIRCFEADDDLRKNNDFGALKAMMMQNEWDNGDFDDLDVDVLSDYVSIRVGQSYEFAIYEDRDKAINYAISLEKDLLDSDIFTEGPVTRFRNILGDDFLDEKSMESDLKDSMESYYNDLDEDDAIEELLRYNVIEDTEDYFGLDEDGDIDHSMPKFDYQYYSYAYAEKYIENIDDIVDEFISNFGYNGIENYVNYDRLSQLIIETDGPESVIASYDGVEREETVDGQTYYIYRVN